MNPVRTRVANLVTVSLISAMAAAGCGNSSTPVSEKPANTGVGSTAVAIDDAPSSSPASAAPEHARTYDVGGHKLYMSCAGHGSPTVVYVHGWVNNAEYTPHKSAYAIRDLLSDDYRVCLYDRRNVGDSETVDAVQKPSDMLRDLERVLKAGHVKPPYILMAASFGGLVAHNYLAHHPKRVAGMVLIDTMFPDELRLDRFLDPGYRFIAYREDDACCTLERISQYDLIHGLQRYIGKEPDIPAIYLASQQEPRNENDYESPEYDARILKVQKAYVDRFSPGILTWVDAPHFMEPVVPDQIADAVREVDRLASQR